MSINKYFERFKAQVKAQGGTILEPAYINIGAKHHVRCAAGHDCFVTPNHVQQGHSICFKCSYAERGTNRKARAWRVFQVDVEAQGGIVLAPKWLGSNEIHHVRCAEGHDCWPRPKHTKQGIGICFLCSHTDADTAWAEFRATVEAQGGTVLELSWLGSRIRHHVQCAEGHDRYVTPNNIQRGQGICKICVWANLDVFYVVTGPLGLKLGITSNDGSSRLKNHRLNGYEKIERLLTDLPYLMAPELEQAALKALCRAGRKPIQGKEYFDIEALPILLSTVDEFMAMQDLSEPNSPQTRWGSPASHRHDG
jgi:hypothetical protein